MAKTFDTDLYVSNKVAQLNDMDGGAGYQGRTDWTEDEVVAAFSDAGLTPEEHYEKWGKSEGVNPWAYGLDDATAFGTTEANSSPSSWSPDLSQYSVTEVDTDIGDFSAESVADEITGLLTEGSTYLDAAQADAMQTANSRGLLNSSIAASSGTDAAMSKAFDIASQDVSARNTLIENKQQFLQQAALQNAQAGNDLTGTSLQGDYGLAETKYQGSIDLEKMGVEQSNTLKQMAAEHGYDLATLGVEQDYTLEQMSKKFGFTMEQLETEQDYILEQIAAENGNAIAQINQKYEWESLLTGMGLDADVTESTLNNITDLNQQYMVEWGKIVSNPDLDAETKEEWISDLTSGFVADLDLIFDTAGIDFEVVGEGEFEVGGSD